MDGRESRRAVIAPYHEGVYNRCVPSSCQPDRCVYCFIKGDIQLFTVRAHAHEIRMPY